MIDQVPPQVMIGLVVLVAVVLMHLRPRPATLLRLFVAPAIVLAVGIVAMAPYAAELAHPTAGDVVFIAVDVALTLTMSLARAASVRIEPVAPTARAVQYRYGGTTLVLWAASLAAKVALSAAGHAWGIAEVLVTGSVLAILGLSVLAQNVVVLVRCRRVAHTSAQGEGAEQKVRNTAVT